MKRLLPWLVPTDHKRVAGLHLLAVVAMTLAGAAYSARIRYALTDPNSGNIPAYNDWFARHGFVMVHFAFVPVFLVVAGNYLVPLMVGGRGLAVRWLAPVSWYLYLLGCGTAAVALGFLADGGRLVGVASLAVALSVVLTAGNLLATVAAGRAAGVRWQSRRLFVWATTATAAFLMFVSTVQAIDLIDGLTAVPPATDFSALASRWGPEAYPHLIAFVAAVPALAVAAEVLLGGSPDTPAAAVARALVLTVMGVAGLVAVVWAVRFATVGDGKGGGAYTAYGWLAECVVAALLGFALVALAVARLLHPGRVTPAVVTAGFGVVFVTAGAALSGTHELVRTDLLPVWNGIHLDDTYFVTAAFHFTAAGAGVGFLAGLGYWWPKATGRRPSEQVGLVAAVLLGAGLTTAFAAQVVMGWEGMPRRYPNYPAEFQWLHLLSSGGALFAWVGVATAVGNLVASLWVGRAAGANPDGATGREWQ